jgi:hypothetical protein
LYLVTVRQLAEKKFPKDNTTDLFLDEFFNLNQI